MFSKIIGLFLAAFFMMSIASAQTATLDVPGPSPGVSSLKGSKVTPEVIIPKLSVSPKDTVGCFDNYHFGSVQVTIDPSLSSTVPGVPLAFSGTIRNDNDYPVVDGSVFVKIFRKGKENQATHQNGYPLVDQFFAAENIVLPAKGESPISFVWNVPRLLESGEYEAATFFVTAKRFNLSGLSFTDDVVGNTASFSIESDIKGGVVFDKNTVTLNKKPHHFANFPLHFDKDEAVTVRASLSNTSTVSKSVPVKWKLYAWDGLRKENMLDEVNETVTLKPRETKLLTYDVKPFVGSVAYVVAEAKNGDAQSILDIRFVRDDVEEVRLNFPGIGNYPLRQGETNKVFACAHSTNVPLVKNNEIILTVKDSQGTTLHSYVYRGDISGAMMGVEDKFVPEKTIGSFTLTATLKHNGKVVEEVKQRYDCKELQPDVCSLESQLKTASEKGARGGMRGKREFFIAVGIVLVLALLFFVMRKVRRGGISPTVILLSLLLSGGIFGLIPGAEAKNVTVMSQKDDLLHYRGPHGGLEHYWHPALSDVISTVRYEATLTDAVTGTAISDNATVYVGQKLRFSSKALENSDISWFGTGHSADSPYGRWIEGGAHPSDNCDAYDYIGKVEDIANGNGEVDVFVPFSIDPPGVMTAYTGTAGLSCNADKTECTVTTPGTIEAIKTFDATFGRFYYAWSGGNFDQPCYPANSDTPLADLDGDSQCTYEREGYINCGEGSGYVPDPYNHPIPRATIRYTLTAVKANTPPTAPIVTGPSTGKQNISYEFMATSTDADGDTLRYGFDWNEDDAVDQWVPGTGYVASGVSGTAAYFWPTAGAKSFQVLAQDNRGAVSAFTGFTITLLPAVPALVVCPTSATVGRGMTQQFQAYYVADGPLSCADVSGAADVTMTAFWSSGNRGVLTVSSTGLATGVSAGTTNVQATYGGATGSATVTVVCVPSNSCDIDPQRNTICSDKTFMIDNGCGETLTCPGKRYCDYNYKEIAP